MYISSVEIVKNYRCFTLGQIFDFKDITLLVGDQGCGKSTLLYGLQRQESFLDVNLSELGQQGVETFYFDTEKMNPRVTDPLSYTNPDGTSKGIGMGTALQSRFQSHGETLVEFTVNTLKKAQNNIIFLDEPESGLSLRNQFRLLKEIDAAVKRKCQIIVATHSLALINSQDSILSLEHKKWMTPELFVGLNL